MPLWNKKYPHPEFQTHTFRVKMSSITMSTMISACYSQLIISKQFSIDTRAPMFV